MTATCRILAGLAVIFSSASACIGTIDPSEAFAPPPADPATKGSAPTPGVLDPAPMQPGAGEPPPATTTTPPAVIPVSAVAPPDGGAKSACVSGVLPADVQTVVAARCQLCHGSPPVATVPNSLVSYDDFARPARSDPTQTIAAVALARVTSTTLLRMPPMPAAALTTGEIDTLRRWFDAGMPRTNCPEPAPVTPGSPPVPPPAPPPPPPDPFAAPAKCTSGRQAPTGGSSLMNSGRACISCHAGNDGPDFRFAGTVYPSAHEPNQCTGVGATAATRGAQVVVVDSAGRTVTVSVNNNGNFSSSATLTPPFRAKVVFMGRERVMIGAVPRGDCNSCHTQAGTTVVANGVKAPGRILLP